MKVTMTQAEIRSLLDALPAGHEGRNRLEPLVREGSTLRVLSEVGLAPDAPDDVRRRFAGWADSGTGVHPSEADARAHVPGAFRGVCTEWGRAGYVARDYPLADGRVVCCRGVWWDVPEPGGSRVAFFFRD
jgi:hypothetical protein